MLHIVGSHLSLHCLLRPVYSYIHVHYIYIIAPDKRGYPQTWQGTFNEYHNICFCGEIRKYQYFSVDKSAIAGALIYRVNNI